MVSFELIKEIEKDVFFHLVMSMSVQHCYFLFIRSRIYQAVKLFMFSPLSGLYSCPLALTDGAAKSIEVHVLC